MDINKKTIITAVSAAVIATVTASVAMSVSFKRMDKIIMEQGGISITDLNDQLSVVYSIAERANEIQSRLYEANNNFNEIKTQLSAITPASEKAKQQKAEAEYAITCFANAITAYQQKNDDLVKRADEMSRMHGEEALSPGSSDTPENSGASFGDKLGMFITGKLPQPHKPTEIAEMAEDSPQRPDLKLLSEMEQFVQGAENKEMNDSYSYCTRTIETLNATVAADKAAAAAAAASKANSAGNNSSGSTKKSSSSSGSYGGTKKSSSSSGGGAAKSAPKPAQPAAPVQQAPPVNSATSGKTGARR